MNGFTDKSRESYDRLFGINLNVIEPDVVDDEHWGRVDANSRLRKACLSVKKAWS